MSASDLATYELQLQQVEAALTTDVNNGELLKLKEDLEQVIDLTRELVDNLGDAKASESVKKASNSDEEVTGSSSSAKSDSLTPIKHWQVGEHCQALHKDGMYYEATIMEISPQNSEVVVHFSQSGGEGRTSLGRLRVSKLGYSGSTQSVNRREQLAKQKEYLKKRKQRKLERMKEKEKVSEDEKNKWKNFSSKAFGKRGFVKKSIFKSPENVQGRVGVGTCGVSGQEMTKYNVAVKRRKGTS